MIDFEKLRRGFRFPWRTEAQIRREVDDELATHLAMRAEQLEGQGIPPAEARARALLEFGDLADASRYCAGVDRQDERRRRLGTWLGEIRQDAAHALRLVRRGPAFAAATVLTLGLALGASTAVYVVLDAYLLRPLPYPEADRLMWVVPAPTLDRFPRAPSLGAVDWSPTDSLFEASAAWDLDGFTVLGDPHPETVTGAWVTPGYFAAVGLRPALGRTFAADEYRGPAPVALVSHGFWVRRFGADSGVIGRTVTIHSADRPTSPSLVTIVGVLPRDFWPIHWRESELLRPLAPAPDWMPQLVRLGAGQSRIAAQARLDAVVRAQLTGPIDPAWHMTLMPALERHSARARPLLLTVFGAALFMLLAACGSVAGALVSRMASRRGELSLRLALGGSRTRVFRQLVTESAVLATLAGTLGLAIGFALLEAGGSVIERQLPAAVPGGLAAFEPAWRVVLLAFAVSTLAGVGLGFVPAVTLLRRDGGSAAAAVLGAGRGGSGREGSARLRRILIAGQVAVATVLLFGAGLMFRTIARMEALPLGFRVEGVVKGSLILPDLRYPDSLARRQGIARLLDRVAETEGVREAAAVFPYPFGGNYRFPVTAEGSAADPESGPRAMVYTVTPGYFATMEIPLRLGRLLAPEDGPAAPLVVLVSEGLARRLAPRGDVIGRRIRIRVPHAMSFDDRDEMPWRTIVGIVGDTEKAYETGTTPDVYVPYDQNPRAAVSLVVRTDRAEGALVEPLRRAVASVDPSLPLSGVLPLAEVVAAAGAQRRGLTVLLGTFAAFALGLSALALYASLSYTIVQRRSELAVRMAIGASAGSILGLVVREGVATAAIGVLVGGAGSLALGRVLERQVYGITTGDPTTLATISAVLIAVAIAACAIPGLRAARTDPATAFRG